MVMTEERRQQLVTRLVRARHVRDSLTEQALLTVIEREVGLRARQYTEALLDESDKLERAL